MTNSDDGPEDDEPEYKTIDELTPDDWIEIKKIAIKYHTSGRYGRDQMKCGVAAFVCWLGMQEESLILEIDPFIKMVH